MRVEPVADPLRTLQDMVDPVLKPLGTAGLVIVFVFFVLLAPSDLRDRFIRLAGSDLHRTTEALSEAASRVSRTPTTGPPGPSSGAVRTVPTACTPGSVRPLTQSSTGCPGTTSASR